MPNKTTVDLDAFAGLVKAQEAGYPVQIKAPDGVTPLGLTITMAGPDSPQQKAGRRKVLDARTADGQLGAMSMEDYNREVAAESALSWTPDIVVGGETLACTPENARKVFTAHPFILDQVMPPVISRVPFAKS